MAKRRSVTSAPADTTPRRRPTGRGSAPPPRPARRPAAVRPSGRPPASVTDVDDPGTMARIQNAAIEEFGTYGLAGARVDRIAASARVNKAMLYYHFGSKEQLYRATIERTIQMLADELSPVADLQVSPEDRMCAFVDRFIRLGLVHPKVAPSMLREIAEGATYIDQNTMTQMLRLVSVVATIVGDGQARGRFRPVNPLLIYLNIVWPIMVYLATGPVRHLLSERLAGEAEFFRPETFIRHMQEVSLRLLAASPSQPELKS